MEKRTVSVICEVNPLHAGHRYILQMAKQRAGQGPVVAIMSGNFVQRGSPAVFDKYTRASALLAAGADLVVELPFPWSSSKAGYFASAGVRIARAMRSDLLLFGSESGNLEALQRMAKAYQDPRYEEILQSTPNTWGEAAAGENALLSLCPELKGSTEFGPNSRLGVAYIQACEKIGLNYEAVPRISWKQYRSASEIRDCMEQENEETWLDAVDPATSDILRAAMRNGWGPVRNKEYEKRAFEIVSLRWTHPQATAEGSGGVAQRILACASKADNADSFWNMLQTKRYTSSRLRRAVLFYVTETPESLLRSGPLYTTVLGANDCGKKLLSEIRRQDDLVLLTKPSAYRTSPEEVQDQIRYAMRADAMYSKLLPKSRDSLCFLRCGPVIR